MRSGEYENILKGIKPPFAGYAVNRPNNYVMSKLGIPLLFPYSESGANGFIIYGVDAETWPKLVVNAYFPVSRDDPTVVIRPPEFHLVYDSPSINNVDLTRCNKLKSEFIPYMPSMVSASCRPYDFHLTDVASIITIINKDKEYWVAEDSDSLDGTWMGDL